MKGFEINDMFKTEIRNIHTETSEKSECITRPMTPQEIEHYGNLPLPKRVVLEKAEKKSLQASYERGYSKKHGEIEIIPIGLIIEGEDDIDE